MLLSIITKRASLTVFDHKSLVFYWRHYGGPLTLLGDITIITPLTSSQRRRLPKVLRDLLVQGRGIAE